MKYPLILLIGTMPVAAVLSACGSSRNGQAPTMSSSAWQQAPLTIDGSDNDWTRPLPGYVAAEKVNYAITNDGEDLYVLLSTKDQQEQQKIIQGGMTVWVNAKGDKNIGDAVGIGYPLDTRSDRDRTLMEAAQPDRYSHKPVTLEDRKDYALYGFVRDSIGTYTYGDDNPQGVRMRMDYNNTGELIYEASLPLTALFPGHSPSASYAAKSVAVGIFIQGLPPGTDAPRGGGGPAIGVDGGLGFGSFGSGGGVGISIGTGSMFGGGRRNKQLFRDAQIWQTVQLAAGHRPF
ncbi:MAG TPA: hypothetical protein VHE54_01105 [Puia sp.]|nr:hypothetical protein [Puia sp.]